MLKLYAKKINKENYDFIKNLENENQMYYEVDILDIETYKEAIVLENNKCIYYKEFETEKKLVRGINEKTR